MCMSNVGVSLPAVCLCGNVVNVCVCKGSWSLNDACVLSHVYQFVGCDVLSGARKYVCVGWYCVRC